MHLGNSEEAVVIGDSANHDNGLVLVDFRGMFGGGFGNNAGDGHWWAIDAGHKEAAEDDFVEIAVCATCKKEM